MIHDRGVPQESWLLLVHQLPSRPVSVRVKAWRRLRQLGAVAAKNSVYVLPDRPETREDFAWVRSEIVGAGGKATVFQATAIDVESSDELREAFRRDRQQDYRAVEEAAKTLARRQAGTRRRSDPRALGKALRAWRERLVQIEAIDYFTASGRQEARAAVGRLEALSAGPSTSATQGAPALDPSAFHHRRWLTRPRPGIDRAASAWLIRRVIDPHATFVFGEPGDARKPGTIAFDMFGGDFTHEGDLCTFEVLCARFGLKDPRLLEIAQLVHDLDLKDGKYGRQDAPLLGALIEGLRHAHHDDQELLERGIALFSALYHGRGGPPPSSHGAPRAAPSRARSKKHGR